MGKLMVECSLICYNLIGVASGFMMVVVAVNDTVAVTNRIFVSYVKSTTCIIILIVSAVMITVDSKVLSLISNNCCRSQDIENDAVKGPMFCLVWKVISGS